MVKKKKDSRVEELNDFLTKNTKKKEGVLTVKKIVVKGEEAKELLNLLEKMSDGVAIKIDRKKLIEQQEFIEKCEAEKANLMNNDKLLLPIMAFIGMIKTEGKDYSLFDSFTALVALFCTMSVNGSIKINYDYGKKNKETTS